MSFCQVLSVCTFGAPQCPASFAIEYVWLEHIETVIINPCHVVWFNTNGHLDISKQPLVSYRIPLFGYLF